MVIRPPDHRLRVFISSTLKELASEREAVRSAVLRLRLVPVMFEAGARPHPARELYRAYLSQSHIFVGIYWESYGWVGPEMSISGLEDEYNLSAHLPRLIYIKAPASQRDAGLESMLNRMQQENTVSYKRFSRLEELGDLVANDLALLLAESYETAVGANDEGDTPASRRPPTNLLFPRNPILGREAELQTARKWLQQPAVGLLTVTGPPGVGKSRLALEVALHARDDFPDGTYLVRLTPVRDPERVVPAIAEAVGLHEAAQDSPAEERLVNFLRGKRMLLLVDNMEHVLEAAPRLCYLSETCPGVKILITSRAPLHLRGEQLLLLAPLRVPNAAEALDTERLPEFASVQLLLQRARSARPDFAITTENGEAIGKIARRLDGLPLALELAASRLRMFTPQQLLERLSRRFEVLSGGPRDLPERQRTLRAAIDWSYELLSDTAKCLFRRLAVFSGGFSIEAVEAACTLDGCTQSTVLESLEVLLDFNLIMSMEGAGGQPRFGMFESIRDYALERLGEVGELEACGRRHLEYYLALVRDVEPRIRSAERLRWQGVLRQELHNLRLAMHRARDNPQDLHMGQQMAIALGHFWVICGLRAEGRKWCDRFIATLDDHTPPAIRAGLLGVAGGLALVSGRDDATIPDMHESLEYARQAADKPLLASCLLWTGAGALTARALSLAWQYLQESLALFRELDDEWNQVLALYWCSTVAFQRGDQRDAERYLQQSVAMARKQGDPWLLVVPLLGVAQRALAEGNGARAQTTLLELEPVLRTVGDSWNLAWVLSGLGQVSMARDETREAGLYFTEALRLARDTGNKVVMSLSLLQAAVMVTQHREQAARAEGIERTFGKDMAGRLCGVAAPLANDPTALRRFGAAEVYRSLMVRVRSAMEPDEWECSFTEGSSMPLDEALDLAATVFQSN